VLLLRSIGLVPSLSRQRRGRGNWYVDFDDLLFLDNELHGALAMRQQQEEKPGGGGTAEIYTAGTTSSQCYSDFEGPFPRAAPPIQYIGPASQLGQARGR